jgi:hypothetical protein
VSPEDTLQESHTTFQPGEHVLIRDERWSVRDAGSGVLHVRGVEAANRHETRALLAAAEHITRVPHDVRLRRRARVPTLRRAAASIAAALPWERCRAAVDASIDLRAWQLDPAIAAVTGATRLLLADGVGLGKTIQSGLIVAELTARGLARRTLIITPASLRTQWAAELRTRFALAPAVFDHAALAAA